MGFVGKHSDKQQEIYNKLMEYIFFLVKEDDPEYSVKLIVQVLGYAHTTAVLSAVKADFFSKDMALKLSQNMSSNLNALIVGLDNKE